MKLLRALLLPLLLALASVAASTPSPAAEIAGQVVTPSGEPVEHAVVFLKGGSVAAPEGERPPAIMDQIDKEFVPHVLPIVVGTRVRFPNHDQIHHHVYSFSRLMSFDLPLYRDSEPPPVKFDRPGVIRVGCNIHDWMSGIIVVLPTPYFAMTDASGAFALENVPPGTHAVLVWHERSTERVEETEQPVELGSERVSLHLVLPLRDAPQRTRENGARDNR
jgi:plastocyanin